jgi:hypothetical protein
MGMGAASRREEGAETPAIASREINSGLESRPENSGTGDDPGWSVAWLPTILSGLTRMDDP